MAHAKNVLMAIATLERRYDGPIPEPLRQFALHGIPEARLHAEALGQANVFAALIRSQIEAIRRARGDGPLPMRLLDDLKLYRREEYWWRRETQRLQAVLRRSADDAP